MPVYLSPGPEQLRDLATVRDLGEELLQKVIDKLSSLDTAIKPSEIQQGLDDVLPDRPDEVRALMNVLMSLYTLRRQRDLDEKELLEGLHNGIVTSGAWNAKELSRWKDLEPFLLKLFSSSTLWSVVKALDLSYDYSNLLQTANILTDIRPVFNDDASMIKGSVVSYTLRIYYSTLAGDRESLSIALDEKDVMKLRGLCDRALRKAQTAKKFMQDNNIKGTFITGEEG